MATKKLLKPSGRHNFFRALHEFHSRRAWTLKVIGLVFLLFLYHINGHWTALCGSLIVLPANMHWLKEFLSGMRVLRTSRAGYFNKISTSFLFMTFCKLPINSALHIYSLMMLYSGCDGPISNRDSFSYYSVPAKHIKVYVL